MIMKTIIHHDSLSVRCHIECPYLQVVAYGYYKAIIWFSLLAYVIKLKNIILFLFKLPKN